TQQHVVSLMTTLASGILYGPAGSAIRSSTDVAKFFDDLRTLYGNDDTRLAEIEYWEHRASECYEGDIPVPALPDFEDYDLGLASDTHFETFRIYVPWLNWDQRGAGLPVDFQINGPAAIGGALFEALDFSGFFDEAGGGNSAASITGPQTFDSNGWLP